MRIFAFLTALLFASGLHAQQSIEGSDILIIGELHDNPGHHALQAKIVAHLAPKAVVYEMLTPDEATKLNATAREASAMTDAAEGMHWTNLKDYADVLAASTIIVGAAQPRDMVKAAFADGAAAQFGEGAKVYGLDQPLPEAEYARRKEAQFKAHCDAMPLEMMGGMVEAQRFRDAAFARTVIEAVETYGRPVVLITGNGHARKDWGVPVYLARTRSDLTVFSLGQSEGEDPRGKFDAIAVSPPAERDDPCKAFE